MKKKYLTIMILFLFMFCHCLWPEDSAQKRKDYSANKEKIQQYLTDMAAKFRTGDRENEENILKEAGQKVFQYLTEDIFPAWYGTAWAFHGETRKPGEGNIACGYFVVHTLQDAGFRIPAKMAKQPSENIIKNLVGSKHIKRFTSGCEMEMVSDWIRAQGEGLFIVGLDIHVGFIIYKNNRMTFCHSSYYDPPLQVVNEDINTENPLANSQYRVLGKILDEKMMLKWIKGEAFDLKYDYFRGRGQRPNSTSIPHEPGGPSTFGMMKQSSE